MNINATLLGQTLAFVIFVAICWKYVWPPIIAIMEEREKRIADGLEAAKKADDSLEEAQLAFDQEINKEIKGEVNHHEVMCWRSLAIFFSPYFPFIYCFIGLIPSSMAFIAISN